MASRRARILAGMPADGPLPIAFGGSGVSEGLIVEFAARDGNWVGNFAPRSRDGSFVDAELHDLGDTTMVVVVAGGGCYVVDVETRQQVAALAGTIEAVLAHADGSVTLADGHFLHTVKRDGAIDHSPRIAWDGMRALCEIDGVIYGEALSPIDGDWHEFAFRRADGVILRAGYIDDMKAARFVARASDRG